MLRKTLILMAIALPVMGALAACDDKGPAEKAGEKIDNAAQSMKDTIDPPGPAEDAGRKIDNTFDSDN